VSHGSRSQGARPRGGPLLSALVLGALWLAGASAHQPHDPIRTLALSPAFRSDGTLLAATLPTTQVPGSRFLLKSSDRGASWRAVFGGPRELAFHALAFSPAFAEDGLVLAGSCGLGVYLSEDRGESWRRAGSGGAGGCAGEIVFSPGFASNRRIYLQEAAGKLLLSTDRGETWSHLEHPGGSGATALRVLPGAKGGDRLLLGTATGLLLSGDGGATWRRAGEPLASDPVETLAVGEAAEGRRPFFAATPKGVWRSGDGGASWTALARIDPGPPPERPPREPQLEGGTPPPRGRPVIEGRVKALVVLGEGELAAATWTGLWLGGADGSAWRKSARGLRRLSDQASIHYRALAHAEGDGESALFVAGWEGVHRSLDAGESWRHLEIIRPYSTRGVAFSPGFAEDGTLFASTYGSGLIVSRDRGQSWTPENEGLWNSHLDPVVPAPDYAEGGTLFVGNLRGVGRRPAAGGLWGEIPLFSGRKDACSNTPHGGSLSVRHYVRAIGLSPSFVESGELIVGGESGCLYRSGNGGSFWELIHDARELVMVIRYLPSRAGGKAPVLAGLRRGGLIRSDDGGRSWSRVSGFPDELTVSDIEVAPGPAGGSAIFASTFERGVWISRDGSESWEPVPGKIGVPVLALALSSSHAGDATLFAATNGAGVLRSADAGGTWSATGDPEPVVLDLALSPAFDSDGTLLAGTLSGPYLSRDGGRSWAAVLDRARYEERNVQITYDEDWRLRRPAAASARGLKGTTSTGASLSFLFRGSGVSWIGPRGPGGGLAELSIDGRPAGRVDLRRREAEEVRELFRSEPLPAGEHLLELRVLPRKGEEAGGGVVVVDAFDVWLAPPPPLSGGEGAR
jgi:photosystem II stability/assembly factor-like uncharacterized protein